MSSGRQFFAGERRDKEEIWQEYKDGKQTYKQLSVKYNCSIKTIQRIIDKVEVKFCKEFSHKANVLMDTTYFGRHFGVMVFKDSISGKYLHKMYVKYETNDFYYKGLETIRNRGIIIQSIICDGRKGLLNLVPSVPIQMCQFRQIQIINRYITKSPKTKSAIELRKLCLKLTKVSKAVFEEYLKQWEKQWDDFLKERTQNPETGKTFYKHKRLRSAW
ncbi:MAG: hypothetical protein ORN85_00350, partial [Sediminibacterium sp.]|nr:hypothetical protein [Sediminibacterium sp.]